MRDHRAKRVTKSRIKGAAKKRYRLFDQTAYGLLPGAYDSPTRAAAVARDVMDKYFSAAGRSRPLSLYVDGKPAVGEEQRVFVEALLGLRSKDKKLGSRLKRGKGL